ncbi:AtpZ/AtpI family protein [Endothiovibrio diazotrophicus]
MPYATLCATPPDGADRRSKTGSYSFADPKRNGDPDWRGPHQRLHNRIGKKAERRLRSRRDRRWNGWFGLGMFGMVGWSVALPTLLGIALGVWLDDRMSTARSWTLTLLFAGLTVGVLVALHWIRQESGEDEEGDR